MICKMKQEKQVSCKGMMLKMRVGWQTFDMFTILVVWLVEDIELKLVMRTSPQSYFSIIFLEKTQDFSHRWAKDKSRFIIINRQNLTS